MLVNLLLNAAKAGARTISAIGRAQEGAVTVEVVDDGRGLPEGYGERLFEPFFTTAAPGEGTGLGLALCHATMQRFGGSIEARPAAAGKGAAFLMRFRPWAAEGAGMTGSDPPKTNAF
jgi:signal transduction histidine kinase